MNFEEILLIRGIISINLLFLKNHVSISYRDLLAYQIIQPKK